MPSVSIRDLSLDFGALRVLDTLNLDIEKGEFLVLLGASGCGKSTLLNCIAGLLEISEGQIWISDQNVTWAEPSKRGIGMVFQSYALYPQMSVEGNLSFGLKNAGVKRDEVKRRVDRAAEILQIEPLMKRKPGALSGGQRQRVAIGRALVRDVDVFLFDEPLSNLDAKLRAELRVELKRLHNRLENTMIYVTHDQVEAMTLADRIAVMKGGMILQLGTPDEIYNSPQTKYVADFIGSPAMNFFEGVVDGKSFRTADLTIPLEGYEFAGRAHGPAWLGIRPEHIASGAAAEGMAFQNEVTVELVEPMGSDTLFWTTLAGQPLRVRLDGLAQVRSNERLRIGFDPARLAIFDLETEVRI